MGSVISSVWPTGALFYLLSTALGFASLLLLAMSISTFLYQAAELAEEYPTLAGIILKKYVLPIAVGAHILLWMDGLAFTYVAVGLACHAAYYATLRTYPLIKLSSVSSIASGVAFLVSHYNWMQCFDEVARNQLRERDEWSNYDTGGRMGMLHMVGFFTLMVWMVPVGIFVSITVNDNMLPGSAVLDGGSSSNGASDGDKGKGANPFKRLYDMAHRAMDMVTDKVYARIGHGSGASGSGSGGSSSGSGSGSGHGGYMGGSYSPGGSTPGLGSGSTSSGDGSGSSDNFISQINTPVYSPTNYPPSTLNQRKAE